MTSFGWKRKAGAGVVRTASQAFENEAKDEELDNEVTRGEVDWLTLAPKKRAIGLEDAKAKSQRLRDEGAILAEAERYWEAVSKWDEALLLTPDDGKMLEMKSQALMAVGEVYPAVRAAQQAVNADPTWWVAHQTLGRAQLNLGELRLAIRSFSKAVLLNPADRELWENDLSWACSVRDRTAVLKPSSAGDSSKVSRTSGACVSETEGGQDSAQDSDDSTDAHNALSRTDIDNQNTDSGVNRTVLNVPSNYVHLRG